MTATTRGSPPPSPPSTTASRAASAAAPRAALASPSSPASPSPRARASRASPPSPSHSASPSAASSASSVRWRGQHGLSPRQRRLLQASARAKAQRERERAAAATASTGGASPSSSHTPSPATPLPSSNPSEAAKGGLAPSPRRRGARSPQPPSPVRRGEAPSTTARPSFRWVDDEGADAEAEAEATKRDAGGGGSGSGAGSAAPTEATTASIDDGLSKGLRRRLRLDAEGGRDEGGDDDGDVDDNIGAGRPSPSSSPTFDVGEEGEAVVAAVRGMVSDRVKALDRGRRQELQQCRRQTRPNPRHRQGRRPSAGESALEEDGGGTGGPLHLRLIREEGEGAAAATTSVAAVTPPRRTGGQPRSSPPRRKAWARYPSDEVLDDDAGGNLASRARSGEGPSRRWPPMSAAAREVEEKDARGFGDGDLEPSDRRSQRRPEQRGQRPIQQQRPVQRQLQQHRQRQSEQKQPAAAPWGQRQGRGEKVQELRRWQDRPQHRPQPQELRHQQLHRERQQERRGQQRNEQMQRRFPSDENVARGVDRSKERFPSDEVALARGVDPKEANLRYYRVAFPGTVALLSEDRLAGDDAGDAGADDGEDDEEGGPRRVGYGEIVATSSPEIVVPVGDGGRRLVRAIRVDAVLAGGGAPGELRDRDRGRGHCMYLLLETARGPSGRPSVRDDPRDSVVVVARPLPPRLVGALSRSLRSAACAAESAREAGPFLYRATSSSPVPVLRGPLDDGTSASASGTGLLPGTVVGVERRVTLPLRLARAFGAEEGGDGDGDGDSDLTTNGDALVDDADAGEVTFLKLARRSGWVADRTVDERDGKRRVAYRMRPVAEGGFGGDGTGVSTYSGGVGKGVGAPTSASPSAPASAADVSRCSTADASFCSLGSARSAPSSVRTPAAVRDRRRRNRRRPPSLGAERLAFPPPMPATSAAARGAAAGGSSFDGGTGGASDVADGSSGTGTATGDGAQSGVEVALASDVERCERRYLMRVLAPGGLKILDAPHFQVSNLIHHGGGPSPASKAHVPRGGHVSPFARTNAMIGSSAESSPASPSPSAGGGRKQMSASNVPRASSPRVRFLARGQIFEASQRMEVTGEGIPYAHGRGLIKLADGSGWAIVPRDEDLAAQLRNVGDDGGGEGTRGRTAAYEEIGNALVPIGNDAIRRHPPASYHQHHRPVTTVATPSKQRASAGDVSLGHNPSLHDDEVVWLRIVAPDHGIKVLLPPPQQQRQRLDAARDEPKSNATPPLSRHNRSRPPSATNDSSEVASSAAGSSFFDSVWSKVSITPTKAEGEKKDGQQGSQGGQRAPEVANDHPFGQKGDPNRQQNPTLQVIPCGMVVPVERWEDGPGSVKSFVRIRDGRGWIPRRLGETVYAREVDPPEVRRGSFWFRVRSVRGADVRRGPSLRAPIIRSDRDDGVSFRFECGEHLRASEVLAVRSSRSGGGSGVAERWAKLYRKRDRKGDRDLGRREEDTSIGGPADVSSPDRRPPLESLVSPGEWVQIHDGNANAREPFLEECSTAPSIERNRDGWRYVAVRPGGARVRLGPSPRANVVPDAFVPEGGEFAVSERVSAADGSERTDWLRLRNGRGWVRAVGSGGEDVALEVGMPNSSDIDVEPHSHRMVRRILGKGS
ncbi:hypothetical protein ACHAWF_014772 [Thalassiosira exigua]